jgi:hypothetical protein
MSAGSEIRVYDYVNHPYEQVRAALEKDAVMVFQSATNTAISRARAVVSQLRVDLGVIVIATDINVSVTGVEESNSELMSTRVTRVQLEWQAAGMPALFPVMKAQLAVYPLTATETQLDFSGVYEPPLGIVGKAVDAAIGYRIAEASVHRFINEVGAYLRRKLA